MYANRWVQPVQITPIIIQVGQGYTDRGHICKKAVKNPEKKIISKRNEIFYFHKK
jgi:hypothetical protein